MIYKFIFDDDSDYSSFRKKRACVDHNLDDLIFTLSPVFQLVLTK